MVTSAIARSRPDPANVPNVYGAVAVASRAIPGARKSMKKSEQFLALTISQGASCRTAKSTSSAFGWKADIPFGGGTRRVNVAP